MAKSGDRVIVEGSKVGGGRREGTLVDVVGRMIRVRWDTGTESIISPAPGAVRFLPGSGSTSRPQGVGTPSRPVRAAKPAPSRKAATSRAKPVTTRKDGPARKGGPARVVKRKKR